MTVEDSGERRASQSLGLIAQALNVPITDFFADGRPASSMTSLSATEADDLAQTAEMLRLFLSLKDLEARRRCIAFVSHEVELKS